MQDCITLFYTQKFPQGYNYPTVLIQIPDYPFQEIVDEKAQA